MRNFIETGFDVVLEDPQVAVSPRGGVVDLGDRVVCTAVGAEPVRARFEVRLEDGFEHQLDAGLNHAVGDGGDAQLPELPGLSLGYHHLPYFDRLELAGFQQVPDLAQVHLDSDLGLDLGRCDPVDACGPGALVVGHAFARAHQDRRFVDEVEQVTEPAGRIRSRPAVQLVLHHTYRGVSRAWTRPPHGAGVHRRIFGHCFPP